MSVPESALHDAGGDTEHELLDVNQAPIDHVNPVEALQVAERA
ncbi:MAG: hypothetical protein Q8K22_11890 [Rhodoferax sp.]|nr:hypothetical protein [Rhodoferax sp.]